MQECNILANVFPWMIIAVLVGLGLLTVIQLCTFPEHQLRIVKRKLTKDREQFVVQGYNWRGYFNWRDVGVPYGDCTCMLAYDSYEKAVTGLIEFYNSKYGPKTADEIMYEFPSDQHIL
jgi:hypothetical protein